MPGGFVGRNLRYVLIYEYKQNILREYISIPYIYSFSFFFFFLNLDLNGAIICFYLLDIIIHFFILLRWLIKRF